MKKTRQDLLNMLVTFIAIESNVGVAMRIEGRPYQERIIDQWLEHGLISVQESQFDTALDMWIYYITCSEEVRDEVLFKML